ncbi:MAG: response regulator [Verrucomicrobiae bacterium]|nr:response regulator [Verrucomicrobiae bacterium]
MKHILIIDDEAPVREVLGRALTRQTYRVTQAANAAEARQAVQQQRPDLIITDLQMEDTDGLELVRELKNLAPGVPVLLLTGVIFDPEVVEKTIRHRVEGYLEKTVPLQRVLEEVRRLLTLPPAGLIPPESSPPR